VGGGGGVVIEIRNRTAAAAANRPQVCTPSIPLTARVVNDD